MRKRLDPLLYPSLLSPQPHHTSYGSGRSSVIRVMSPLPPPASTDVMRLVKASFIPFILATGRSRSPIRW